jgi:hypothetical protein
MSALPTPHTEEHDQFTQEAIRNQKILTGISRALEAAKVKHQGDRAAAVSAVRDVLEKDGVVFSVGDRGWIKAEKAGQSFNLQAKVDEILLTNRNIGDPASVQSVVESGALEVEAKSDLVTAAQKAAFITKHGLAKWLALPLHRETTIDMNPLTMSAKDYGRLTVRQRIDFQKLPAMTEQMLGQILKRR